VLAIKEESLPLMGIESHQSRIQYFKLEKKSTLGMKQIRMCPFPVPDGFFASDIRKAKLRTDNISDEVQGKCQAIIARGI